MKEYIFFSFLNKQKCQYLWFENDLCMYLFVASFPSQTKTWFGYQEDNSVCEKYTGIYWVLIISSCKTFVHLQNKNENIWITMNNEIWEIYSLWRIAEFFCDAL